jgi:preprotein translocase subunit SecA
MPPPEHMRLEELEEELHGEDANLDEEINFSHAEAESSLSKKEFSSYEEKEAENSPYKREEKKVGQNELCPCGSNKKYKKCHGSKK